jgi:hypothetical protein
MNAPSSRPPAGVPESGSNAKYAIVAILLLLAAGGIFAWRNLTNRNETPAPIPTMSVAQSATPPPNPKIDDVPLPPPPDDKPEGGAGPKIVYVQAGGCDATCKGAATPELQQALQVRGMQARRCYNQALATDSSLKGKVSIAVKIGPAGNVCSASVASNDMGSPAVANCAANIFRASGGYPAPHGGCIDANVPLSFVPQGGAQ